MRKACVLGALSALAVASAAGAANLNVVVTNNGSAHDPDGGSFGVGSTRGGIFTITINNTTGLAANQLGGDIVTGKVFDTFCVEVTENLASGANYNFNVNTGSVQGGASPLSPQPLVAQTAFLYSTFRTGGMASIALGGTWSGTDDDNVNALQDAIWFFQNQLGVADVHDNNLVTLSAQAAHLVGVANNAVNTGSWVGIGNVRILNLGSGPNYANQDVLALVPLPQGVGLAGAAMLLAGVRRRRSL